MGTPSFILSGSFIFYSLSSANIMMKGRKMTIIVTGSCDGKSAPGGFPIATITQSNCCCRVLYLDTGECFLVNESCSLEMLVSKGSHAYSRQDEMDGTGRENILRECSHEDGTGRDGMERDESSPPLRSRSVCHSRSFPTMFW